jgi:hypothetical protein
MEKSKEKKSVIDSKVNKIYEVVTKISNEIFDILLKNGYEPKYGFYNEHYILENDDYVMENYPIPVIDFFPQFTKNGILNYDLYWDGSIGVELNGSIWIEFCLDRVKAIRFEYNILKKYDFEVYGNDEYLEDYYNSSMRVEDIVEKLKSSNEKEINILTKFEVFDEDDFLIFIKFMEKEIEKTVIPIQESSLFDNIQIIKSKWKSGAVVDIYDNILIPELFNNPPVELISKLYQSNHLKDYDSKYHDILTKQLGFYCDLQSIKSEDAIVFSYFGYIKNQRHYFQKVWYDSFIKFLFGEANKDYLPSIDLWKRVPHPDTLVPGGPEIDVFIVGTKYYFLIECKWDSPIDSKQGKSGDKDQLQLRKEWIEKIGSKVYPNKTGHVLLVDREKKSDVGLTITWDELSELSTTHKTLFKQYLEWKKSFL